MTTVIPIGTTRGPGETAHEYTFITPDREDQARHSEFVFYEAEVDGEDRRILGRITQRQPARLLPDGFLAEPSVAPAEIAALIGYVGHDHNLFEITVSVLGYYDTVLSDFINPHLPPRPGTSIHIADNEMLAGVLSKRRMGQTAAAHIGSLLSRPDNAVPIVVDLRAITSTHLAVIASTGSGKSYLAGVLVEELMQPWNRAAVLIIDPHGEYHTLTELQGMQEFSTTGYAPRVEVIRPETVKVRISSLSLGDIRALLPDLSERMHYVLAKGYRLVQDRSGTNWTLTQLIAAIEEVERQMSGKAANEGGDEGEGTGGYGTAGALAWRLNSRLQGSRIFDDMASLPLQKLFRPGQCTVLQLNEIDEREQQVVVATLLRRLFKARMATHKGQTDRTKEDYLPYPAFALIEEAHRFAPASADLVSSQVLKTILAEGRKFGVAVGLISQRPGKLDPDVLSQCMTQFFLHITNPSDRDRVAESVESVGRDLLEELPALSKGQVIIAGAAVNTPVLCRVRRRLTTHGAEDVDAPAQWLRWFEEDQEGQDRVDDALPREPDTRGRSKLFK